MAISCSWAKVTEKQGLCHSCFHGIQHKSVHHPLLWGAVTVPLFSSSPVHIWAQRGRPLSLSMCGDTRAACQGHPLNNCPFFMLLYSPPPRLHDRTPSISPFTLTLFLTPLVSRTPSGTGREEREVVGEGGEIENVKKRKESLAPRRDKM